MTQTEIQKKITDIVSIITGLTDISSDVHISEISEWDSLKHIQIITEIEKIFSISFELDEMLSFETISDICNSVNSKI
jgi:acyl carrier protein